MKSLKIKAESSKPEIILSPEENIFSISGKSAPEDVRELFYPVIDWLTAFAGEIKTSNPYTDTKPLLFKVDLAYFNSSSAKFLYDIFTILKEIREKEIPVTVEWHYDDEDIDLKEAGEDMALLSGLEFKYCTKSKPVL
jgi:hypothetical protein